MITSMATAFAFLTRLPVRASGDQSADVGAAATWFPLVGLVVGAIVGIAHFGFQQLLPSTVAAAIAVAVGILVTGAFHEDGLGDIADGFGGGWTVEERLRIMADPRQGTYGVAAIACSILIRVAAIGVMEGAKLIAVVAGAHLLARNLAALGLGMGRPAHSYGLAGSMMAASEGSGNKNLRAAIVGSVWILVFLVVVGSAIGLIAAVAMAAAATMAGLSVVGLARSKIGGVTGDVLGAVEQLAECAALVAATAFVPF